MRNDAQYHEKTSIGMYDDADFEEFLPFLGIVSVVARRFTPDPSDAETLLEKALVMAVQRRHHSLTPQAPKMALLGALREAYLQSSESVRA